MYVLNEFPVNIYLDNDSLCSRFDDEPLGSLLFCLFLCESSMRLNNLKTTYGFLTEVVMPSTDYQLHTLHAVYITANKWSSFLLLLKLT